jgi:hypothetical protein
MHAHARVAGQDADGVGRFRTSLGVDGGVREATRAGHMHPGQLACPPAPGLVMVQYRRPPQRGHERRLHRLAGLCCLLDPVHQGAARQVRAEQIGR